MSFSQRIGVTSDKPIQIGYISDSLRNRLFNTLNSRFEKSRGYISSYDNLRNFVLDKLGYNLEDSSNNDFNNKFLHGEWYVVYEILEFVFDWLDLPTGDIYSSNKSIMKPFAEEIQKVLEEEKSGYRLLEYEFVPITNIEELSSLEESLNTKYSPVKKHISKAINLYSDRKNPDYENSIKESISAVESICCIITNSKGSQATLGKTLKDLKNNGVVIHPALEEAFNKMYGYTSDNDGTRHGSIDFKNAPAEDAKFMLISCSAFINYLIEKLSKAGG